MTTDSMPRLKITADDIARIKRQHILENLSYSVTEAAEVLGVKARKIYMLVDEGELDDANDTPGSKGTLITALSIERYQQKRLDLAKQYREGKTSKISRGRQQ